MVSNVISRSHVAQWDKLHDSFTEITRWFPDDVLQNSMVEGRAFQLS